MPTDRTDSVKRELFAFRNITIDYSLMRDSFDTPPNLGFSVAVLTASLRGRILHTSTPPEGRGAEDITKEAPSPSEPLVALPGQP